MIIIKEIKLDELKKTRQELKLLIEAAEVRIILRIEDLSRRISRLEKENEETAEIIEILERDSLELI